MKDSNQFQGASGGSAAGPGSASRRRTACENSRRVQLWDELNRLTRWLKTVGTTYDVEATLAELEYRVRTMRGALDEAGFQAVIRTFEEVPLVGEVGGQGDSKDFILSAESKVTN